MGKNKKIYERMYTKTNEKSPATKQFDHDIGVEKTDYFG